MRCCFFFVSCLLFVCACGGDDSSPAVDGGGRTDGSRTDAGGRTDGGGVDDSGAPSDAGSTDASASDAAVDGGGADASGADAGGSDGGTDPLACPGFTTPPDACRTGADCTGALDFCIPYGTPLCGTCMKPLRTCESDPDCSSGDVCVDVEVSCSCGGLASECQAACTGTCPAGQVCSSTGHCDPQPCDAGYDCGMNHRCDPTSSSTDEHGCVTLSCDADVDCDCGVCIGGKCAPVLGACGVLPA